jgi:hypothetical protein
MTTLMARIIAVVLCLTSASVAQVIPKDPAAILAKARTAFIENQARQRFWNWTTLSTRTVTDKDGTELETLPSVTIESPIRSDGKRCNAILAWGDGVEPYLANASADERCAVEMETPDVFRMDAFLESRQVKIQSRTPQAITLTIREDKQAMESTDPVKHCVASVRGTVRVDPVSFFPTHIEVTMPSTACIQKRVDAANHYDDTPLRNVTGGSTKGTFIRYDYELQKDKGGDSTKDFWICTRRYSIRPLQKGAGAMVISGRRFPLQSSGDRRMAVETRTSASELSAESQIKFETEKEK